MLKSMEKNCTAWCISMILQFLRFYRGMYLGIENSIEFENIAREVYQRLRHNKYVVSRFITALVKNKNINAIVETIFNSVLFRNVIKEEILYCNKFDSSEQVLCLACIAIGQLKEALRLIEKINDSDVRLIYKNYISHILGEQFE